ncbi:MAG: peptide chain release factor N(5)-glutamine methyltransferase [Pseudomonadota bacterium]
MGATGPLARALAGAARRLAAAGIEGAAGEARLLVGAALGWEVERVLAGGEGELSPAAAARLEPLLSRREARAPLSQLLGRREFWSLDFQVTPDVLTPRPDSESVVEAALAMVGERTRPAVVLDLGTGTGCLLLALLAELPNAWGVGIDVSPAALAVARCNAAALGLGRRAHFAAADWGGCLGRAFDLVVANPPYIRCDDIAALEPEVRLYEPRLALAGGPDGLEATRALAGDLGRLLAADGAGVIEIGSGQAGAVETILRAAGLEPVARRRDLAGRERCVAFRRTGARAKNDGR